MMLAYHGHVGSVCNNNHGQQGQCSNSHRHDHTRSTKVQAEFQCQSHTCTWSREIFHCQLRLSRLTHSRPLMGTLQGHTSSSDRRDTYCKGPLLQGGSREESQTLQMLASLQQSSSTSPSSSPSLSLKQADSRCLFR